MSIPILRVAALSSTTRRVFIHAHVSARPLQDQTHRELVYRPLQFHERGQLLISPYDETLAVAMRVHNPNRSDLEDSVRDTQAFEFGKNVEPNRISIRLAI